MRAVIFHHINHKGKALPSVKMRPTAMGLGWGNNVDLEFQDIYGLSQNAGFTFMCAHDETVHTHLDFATLISAAHAKSSKKL